MKLQLVSTMVACLIVAQGVAAEQTQQEQAWNRHTGYYAEGNLGITWALWGIEMETDAIPAWVGALGYSFTEHHAVEIGFGQSYGNFDDEDRPHWIFEGLWRTKAPDYVSGSLNLGYLAWRGTVPIKDRWAFFGKLGVTVMDIPGGANDGTVMAFFNGVGLSYAVTPRIDISLQAQGGATGAAYAAMWTLGVAYHF